MTIISIVERKTSKSRPEHVEKVYWSGYLSADRSFCNDIVSTRKKVNSSKKFLDLILYSEDASRRAISGKRSKMINQEIRKSQVRPEQR
jgi:hypothetical protein